MKQKNPFYFLGFAALATAAASFGVPANANENRPNLDITFDQMKVVQNGQQELSGNVVLSYDKLTVETDKLTFDYAQNHAEIHSPALANYASLKIVTDRGEYATDAKLFKSPAARGNANFAFFDAEGISATNEFLDLGATNLYYGEPDWATLSLHLAGMHYFVDDEKIRLESPKICIAGVPVLPLPTMTVPRFDRPPIRAKVELGSDSHAGTYLRTTTYLTLWREWEPGLLLDMNEMAGPMVGPALDYNVKIDSENWFKGHFLSGYINDTCNREPDRFGQDVTGNRGFIDWFHKQEIAGTLELTASMHYWSDSEVVDDYRDTLFNENQNPDNYIEAVIPGNDLYVSALTRLHINKFRNTQERLPEFRVDWLPASENLIKNQAFFSFASLRERDASTILAQHNHHDDQLISNRFDFYYGLTMPLAAGDFFSFTPVAGFRETFYGNTVPENGNSSTSRTLGQFGFDMALNFSGTNNYQNETWQIDGLRHVFRPVLQYRYIAGLGSQDSDRIPAIDREFYLSRPSIIDISDTRSIDQIYDRHVLRLGFENLIQTRNPEYGSRDLLEFNIYQDWRDSMRPDIDNRAFSDNFIELIVKPAPWIAFDYAQRTEVYHFDAKSISTGITFTDGNLWSLRLGREYLNNPDLAYYRITSRSRQYTLHFTYRLNSRLTFYTDWRYDDLKSLWNNFEIGCYHRLNNCWKINYYWAYDQDEKDGSDVSFGASVELMVF